jgi:hypothetical protein
MDVNPRHRHRYDTDDDEDEDDRFLRELHEQVCAAEMTYMECTTASRRLAKKLERVRLDEVQARLRLLRLRKEFQRIHSGCDDNSADVDVQDEYPSDDDERAAVALSF